MEHIAIQTPHNVTIEYPLASLGDRILAFAVDFVVQYSYVIAALNILDRSPVSGNTTPIVLILMPFLLYHPLCEIFFNGQSLGKRLMKIKVIGMNGNAPSLGAYLTRAIMRIVEVDSLFGGMLAVMAILVGGKGQRLGDMAAGTTVVKLREPSAQGVYWSNLSTSYTPQYPEVAQLNDRDIQIVKEVVYAYRRTYHSQPLNLAADKIKQLLHVKSDMPNLKFLETIVKDYNHLTSEMLR